MMGLTPEQGKLLRFIKNYSDGHDGVMPSVAEMTDAVGLRSKSGVVRLLDGLVDRAAIRRIPNRARAIEIVEDGGLIISTATERTLRRYCEQTRAMPNAIVTEALAEYFSKRGFPA